MAKEKKATTQIIEKKDTKTQNITITLLVIACILLVIILLVVIKGHEAKLKDGKEIIASITGKDVTAEDLFDELKAQYGTNIVINTIDDYIANKEIPDNTEAKKYAKAQLDALKQQYEASGYDFSTVLTKYGYESETELLNVFVADYKKTKVVENYLIKKLTDDEIQKYYDEEVYGKLTAKHILIKPETTTSMTDDEKKAKEEEAKKKAEEIIQKLNDGASWSDLVKEYSNDTGSKDKEGLIENFEKDDVVEEFFTATLALKDGEYSKEPVKSTYGYHIILRVKQGEKAKLDDIKDEVKSKIVSEKLSDDSKLADNTWVNIRKDYKLEINDTKIKKIYESVIKG